MDKKTVYCHVCEKQTNYVIDSFSRYHLKPEHNITLKEYYDKYLKTPGEGICIHDECNNETVFVRLSKGYRDFCSIKCRNSSKKMIEKTKETNIKKFGSTSPSGNSEIQEKIKQTNLKKYGVNCVFKNSDIKQKIKQTNLKKYGVDNAFKNPEIRAKCEANYLKKRGVKTPFHSAEIQEKIKQDNIKKYGVESLLQIKKVQEQIKQTNLEKYGVEYPSMNKEVMNKTKQTNLKKHGFENVSQSELIKNKVKRTYRKNFWDIFTSKLGQKKIQPLFDVDFFVNNDVLNFKCLRCDKTFTMDITNPQKINCGCLKNRSGYEDEIIDWLLSLNIDKNDIESNKDFFENGKKKFEIDVFLSKLNIGIEFHGLYWHSDICVNRNYHYRKYEYFKEKNITLLQIFENEWVNSEPIVKSIIKTKLNLNDRIYARKCVIKEVDNNIYKLFLEKNHIQGFSSSKIKIGLFHNNELVSVIGISKSRFNKNYDYELVRFCNKQNVSVIGGFSKLLKFFETNHKFQSIISYSDLRYFNGNGYVNNGFKFLTVTNPNYFYFKNRILQLYNRIEFQKHKLKNKLNIFDDNKSEYENMIDNGYLRIFDAGNNVFIKDF